MIVFTKKQLPRYKDSGKSIPLVPMQPRTDITLEKPFEYRQLKFPDEQRVMDMNYHYVPKGTEMPISHKPGSFTENYINAYKPTTELYQTDEGRYIAGYPHKDRVLQNVIRKGVTPEYILNDQTGGGERRYVNTDTGEDITKSQVREMLFNRFHRQINDKLQLDHYKSILNDIDNARLLYKR